VLNGFAAYRAWIFKAAAGEITLAILAKSVAFLYLRIFWPYFFSRFLPGLHVFTCPQCYGRRVFQFRPISLQLDFYVTYLCRHCSCLVDGCGRQVFYPVPVTYSMAAPYLLGLLPASGAAVALGAWTFRAIWNIF